MYEFSQHLHAIMSEVWVFNKELIPKDLKVHEYEYFEHFLINTNHLSDKYTSTNGQCIAFITRECYHID